jgi:hypothetical protein
MPQARIAVVSIGINYKGQNGELYGCVNDSENFMNFVGTRFKHHLVFRKKLVDTLPARHPRYPTKRNIQRALNQAVNLCRRRNITHLWVHYSGHGGQQRDRNRDERDRLDETLIPVDWARSGTITDDWLLARVVNRVPPRTHFFGLIDACHSASMLDLRFGLEPVADRRFRHRIVNRRSSQRPRAIMISGCRDHRYSYDTWDKTYGFCGAMTTSFLRQMVRRRKAPLAGIVRRMRAELRGKGYPQIPQVSATRRLRGHEKIPGFGNL